VEAIHDHLVHGDAGRGQSGDGIARLLQGQGLGQEHPREDAARTVAEQRRELTALGLDLGDQRVGGVAPVAAAQALGQESVLGQHGVERAGDAAQQRGRGQQSQGMAGGRRVHDDLVAAGHRGQTAQLDQPDQLVDAGQAEVEKAVDVVVVQVGPAPEDRAQGRGPCC
jgi:hypothetical protein